jgi:DNA-binding NarL/FixJ family response regulator
MDVKQDARLPVRVAVVDDHTLFRQGLRMLLEEDAGLQVVAEAGDAQTAIESIDRADPDVVLLDLVIPPSSGTDIARELKRRNEKRNILMLTMRVDAESAARSFDAGASGFAGKDEAPDDLRRAIRAVASGGTYLCPLLEPDVVAAKRSTGDALHPLTAREREVFHLIVLGMSNQAIASRLSISRRTVETHRARILQKVRAHSSVDLVRFAARNGLLPDAQ